MPVARVTSRGQVTIPVEIRRDLDIDEGDSLIFEFSRKSEATVRVIKQRKVSDLFGSLAGKGKWPGKKSARAEVARYLGSKIR